MNFFYGKTIVVNSIGVGFSPLAKNGKNQQALAKTYILNTNGTNELHKCSQAKN